MRLDLVGDERDQVDWIWGELAMGRNRQLPFGHMFERSRNSSLHRARSLVDVMSERIFIN